jgi:hypothetical protein
MTVMDDTEAKEKAEFNSAITALNRLNACWAICTESKITTDASAWFRSCMAAWMELSPYCTADQDAEFMQISYAINARLFKEMRNRPGMKMSIENTLFWMIFDFEKKLRKISHAFGLDMKMKEDRRFGL